MRRRPASVLSLWSVVVASAVAPVAAQAGKVAPVVRSDVPGRPGEAVVAGRWVTDGGGVGRNAWSANAPLVRRPTLAWRVALDGRLVGEPRVWDEVVVLGLEVDDKRRRVEVRRLSDGEVLGAREINSTARPDVALWGDEIVWRSADGCFELLRVGDADVSFVARMRKVDRVGPPVRLGADVFAVVDGSLRCLRAADFRERWTAGEGCVGRVSLRDGTAYVLTIDRARRCRVLAVDARTGAEQGRSDGLVLTDVPGDDATLQLAGRALLARFGDGQLLAEYRAPGVKLNGADLRLPVRGAKLNPMAHIVPHALDASVHVAPSNLGRGFQLALYATGEETGIRLDSCERHRELGKVPATLVRGVAYFGACAVETTGFRVLWRIGAIDGQELPRSRAIPAGRSLLLFDEGQLVALREDAPADPVAGELRLALRTAERDRLEPLVDAALKARDWDLAEELLTRCRELRSDERWTVDREKDVVRGRKRKRLKVKQEDADAVREALPGVAGGAFDEVSAAVAKWPEQRSALEHRAGLRFLLARADGDARAALADRVRALLPANVAPPEPFRPLDWLDWLGAAERTEVRFLDASLEEFEAGGLDPIDAQNKQQLLEWRDRWREDLQALQSDRLLLFSAITQPGSLAKALATGELVCDLLESMFAHMEPVRDDPRPMLVFIYPDRDDYLKESAKLGNEIAVMAAGYYSPQEKPAKSRLYVPSDDAGFRSVLPTLAHELTHHWLMDRCRAFRPDPAAALYGPKAFWIVEGFASLVEQFEFDFERRKFALGKGGDLGRADMVASLGFGQRLKWDWLVGATRMDYARILRDPKQLDVASFTRLGRSYAIRKVDLFYAQSAMLARYLYEAEDGRYRQQLLDYVVAYYTGDLDALDFEQAFGVSAKTLGPKVTEFAKKLVE